MVSLLCGTLVVAGFTAKFLQRWIVPTAQNPLADAREDFLSQAREQRIDWRRLDDKEFADARRLNRPILLVVGTGASEVGRAFDQAIFANQDVQGVLKRYFVCIRIDSDDQPQFRGAFVPLARLQTASTCGFAAHILDVDGKLLHSLLPIDANQRIDYHDFLAFLRQGEAMFDRHQDAAGGEPGSVQIEELRKLRSGTLGEVPSLGQFETTLDELSNSQFGGFPWRGYQTWFPLVWQYWLMTGQFGKFNRSIEPALESACVDWFDGGFFRAARTADWSRPEYDNRAVIDAEMAWTLALSAQLQANATHRAIAAAAIDGLLARMVADGYIASFIQGDERELERSRRASFTPRELRAAFPESQDRDWVQDRLRMRPAETPSMVPRPRDDDVLLREGERLQSNLDRMRAIRKDLIKLGGKSYLDVNGTVAARLLQCARLWSDANRLRAAEALCDRLSAFRSGDDVAHRPISDGGEIGYLTDYVAYVDSQLQLFLASGRASAFRSGLAVLRRALDRFSTGRRGEFRVDANPKLYPPDIDPPAIVDEGGESPVAGLCRLCYTFGSLLAPKAGASLLAQADAISQRYARISPGLGPFAGGMAAAALRLSAPEIVIAIGPRSSEWAAQIAQARPTRLVAPRIAEIREDLIGKPVGIYVIRFERITGPLTVDQALSSVTASLAGP